MGWFIDFVWWYCYGFSFFRCLVFCRVSFCKVLSCWRSDILLIGWWLSATVFIPIYFSFADVLFPFMFLFPYLYRCNALNSNGDIYGVVLLFRFSFTQRLTCILTCWMVHGIFDDMMLGLLDLCSVCQIFSIRLYTFSCSAIRIGWQLHQSIGWLIDRSVDVWLIGWSTDRLTHSLIGWLLAERL